MGARSSLIQMLIFDWSIWKKAKEIRKKEVERAQKIENGTLEKNICWATKTIKKQT